MPIRLRPLAACAALALVVACVDSVARLLDPDVNDVRVTNTAQEFRLQATDLRNVNDRVSYRWTNSAPVATFLHRTFIHHGTGIVVVRDALGAIVDSTLLEFELDTETRPGVPGQWTIELFLNSARGRVDFTLSPKP